MAPSLTAMKRPLTLVLIAVFTLALASPAFATESSGEEEPTTETTVAEEPDFGGTPPAVVIPPADAEEEEQPWTARFIYPTIVIITILLVIGTAVMYNRSVRKRYKVVADT